MKYAVEFTPSAEAQLTDAFRYICQQSPLNAERWLRSIYNAVDSLETYPNRCGVAPEAKLLDQPLRHYIFKSHRIIFIVDERKKIVRILHVRHGARRAVGEREDDDDQK